MRCTLSPVLKKMSENSRRGTWCHITLIAKLPITDFFTFMRYIVYRYGSCFWVRNQKGCTQKYPTGPEIFRKFHSQTQFSLNELSQYRKPVLKKSLVFCKPQPYPINSIFFPGQRLFTAFAGSFFGKRLVPQANFCYRLTCFVIPLQSVLLRKEHLKKRQLH